MTGEKTSLAFLFLFCLYLFILCRGALGMGGWIRLRHSTYVEFKGQLSDAPLHCMGPGSGLRSLDLATSALTCETMLPAPRYPLPLSYFLLTFSESFPLSNTPSFHSQICVYVSCKWACACTFTCASTEEGDIGGLFRLCLPYSIETWFLTEYGARLAASEL